MPISVGEVSATLRFTIQQADIQAAKANLRDLTEQFREAGGAATESGSKILNQMIPAQAQLDKMNASAAATKAELREMAKGEGLEAVAAQAAVGADEMSKFEGVATRMLERLAVLYALRETFNFVTGIYEASDAMIKMADETGYSVQAIEQWDAMAGKADITTQQIDKSMQTFQKNIFEMKPATSDALHAIGLDFEAIFALNPDDRLNTVAEALSGVADQTERNNLEMKLFGTDAIDPLIKRFEMLKNETKDAAIDPGTRQVLAGVMEDYKALGGYVENVGAAFLSTGIKATAALSGPIISFFTGGLEGAKIATDNLLHFSGALDTLRELGHSVFPGLIDGVQQLDQQVKNLDEDAAKPAGPLMGQAFIDSLKIEAAYTQDQYDKLKELKNMHELTIENAVRAADVTTAQYKAIAGAIEDAAKAAKKLAEEQKKQAEQEAMQLVDSERRWAEYADLVVSRSGTANQKAEADVYKWAATVTEAAVRGKKDTADFYNWLETETKAKLDGIGVNWQDLKKNSIEALQETYDNAQKTFEEMTMDGLHHSQAQIQHFRDIRDAALDALHNQGEAAQKAKEKQDDLTDSIMKTAVSDKQWAKQIETEHSEAWAVLNADLDNTTIKVKTLAGEWITAKQAKDRFDQGSSFTYDLSTQAGIDQYRKMNPAAQINWSDQDIMAYVNKGGNLQGLIATGVINPYGNMGATSAQTQAVPNPPPPSSPATDAATTSIRSLSAASSPTVSVPSSGSIFSGGGGAVGAGGPAGGITVNQSNTFNVNGTIEQSAQRVGDIFMNNLKYSRQFGAA